MTSDALFMISACFWVFYWKNTSIPYWGSWNFSCMELQVRRYQKIYICPYFLLVKTFWLCCVCYFVHLLINLCKNVTTTLDIEFGRLQARDMLQHLWTGPISNASVDVIQGGRSVEVRAVGVTKVPGSLFITVLCLFISRVIPFATRKKNHMSIFHFQWFYVYTGCSYWSYLGRDSSLQRHEVTYWLCPVYWALYSKGVFSLIF